MISLPLCMYPDYQVLTQTRSSLAQLGFKTRQLHIIQGPLLFSTQLLTVWGIIFHFVLHDMSINRNTYGNSKAHENVRRKHNLILWNEKWHKPFPTVSTVPHSIAQSFSLSTNLSLNLRLFIMSWERKAADFTNRFQRHTVSEQVMMLAMWTDIPITNIGWIPACEGFPNTVLQTVRAALHIDIIVKS